jgi:Arc/MetJ-type ribon-helix-helix transcriptional regulator
MARPRIEGMEARIVDSFVSRGIFTNQREVISAALRALVREQKAQEASQRNNDPSYQDSTYEAQLESPAENKNASVGRVGRSSTAR